MSPVNESDTRGLPDFIIKDIPPESSANIEITQPAIYFGEATTDYIVVNTTDEIEEFDYPVGDENAFTSYDGDGRCRGGQSVRRAAFALRFGASQILFSNYITPESRVLFERDISDPHREARSVDLAGRRSVPGARRWSDRVDHGRLHVDGQVSVLTAVLRDELHAQLGEDHRRCLRRHDDDLRVRPG